MSEKLLLLQASCAGYGNAAATVFATIGEQTGALIVTKVAKEVRRDRFRDCAIVTNMKMEAWESWFTDADLADAIEAYQRRVSEGTLQFRPDGRRADPAGAIQVSKVSQASGRGYEIAPEMTSAQVATLMLCWHVARTEAIADSFEFGDKLAETLRAGGIVSI